MHPHRLADTLEELLANGTELSRAERRALLYPLAAHSPTIHLWLRWTTAFTPVFSVALLLLLAGMLTALAGAPPTLADTRAWHPSLIAGRCHERRVRRTDREERVVRRTQPEGWRGRTR